MYFCKKNNITFYINPKCGISFIHSLVSKNENIEDNRKLNIYIIRNPYERLVSYYCDKVLNLSTTLPIKKNQGNKYYIQRGVKNILQTDKDNFSFREFIDIVSKLNLKNCDGHLSLQKENYDQNIKYNLVIDIKNINPLKELFKDWDFNLTDIEKNKTLKEGKDTICCDFKREDFIKNLGVPKDFNLFFDEEIKNKINEIYRDDIELYFSFFKMN